MVLAGRMQHYRSNPNHDFQSKRWKNPRGGGGKPITLTELRLRAKRAIEDAQLFKRDTFDCWIHEDEPALPADRDAWDSCLARARRSHIVLMLFNGDAGSGIPSATIGICHAEAAEALGTGPGKVRIVNIRNAMVAAPPSMRVTSDSTYTWTTRIFRSGLPRTTKRH